MSEQEVLSRSTACVSPKTRSNTRCWTSLIRRGGAHGGRRHRRRLRRGARSRRDGLSRRVDWL